MNHVPITQLQQLNIAQSCFKHSSREFGLVLLEYFKENTTHRDLLPTKKEKHQRRTSGKMEFLKLRYPEYSLQYFWLVCSP